MGGCCSAGPGCGAGQGPTPAAGWSCWLRTAAAGLWILWKACGGSGSSQPALHSPVPPPPTHAHTHTHTTQPPPSWPPRSATNVAAGQALSALQAAALAGNSTGFAAATKDLEKAIVTIWAQARPAAPPACLLPGPNRGMHRAGRRSLCARGTRQARCRDERCVSVPAPSAPSSTGSQPEPSAAETKPQTSGPHPPMPPSPPAGHPHLCRGAGGAGGCGCLHR